MNFRESEAFASRCHKDVVTVTDFMVQKVKSLSDSVNLASDRDVYIHGLYFRAIAWMLSLRKLNDGVDFQPIVSGARTFLEITTDLVLIHYDKTNESGWRMRWWGMSAKLKSAKALVEYFNNRARKPISNEYQDVADFVTNEEAGIEHMKKALWPDPRDPNKGRHPERWTGRSNLLDDVREADRLHGARIERHFGSTLEEFYETEYRRMNWNVHGSGLTGIRDVDEVGINIMRALGYNWSAKLAMVCTDIVLQDFKDSGMTGAIDHVIPEAEYISVNLVK